MREAATIWRQTAGEKSTRVGTVRNNLGFALLELGRAGEARRELEAALAIRAELLGAESAEVAQTLRILGLARLALGDRAGARPTSTGASSSRARSMPSATSASPKRSPRAPSSRSPKAATADARRDLEEALAIREEKLGKENPLTEMLRKELARLPPG